MSSADATAQKAAILFVDDEPAVRQAFLRTAQHAGWEVDAAENAQQGLQLAEQGRFCVIIADFWMPGMDGVEFLTVVKQKRPDAERMLMTAFADEETLERAVNQAGISRFLRKPWRYQALVESVESALAQVRLRRDNAQLMEELCVQAQELADANRLLADRVVAGDAALVRAQHQSSVALNAISDPVIIVDGSYRVSFANAAAAALADSRSDMLPGQQCHAVLFGRSAPCSGCPMESGRGTLHQERDGRESVFQARAYALPDVTTSYLCVYHDVTQEHAFEREAAKVDKLAAIGRLSSGIAHELNNPLHAIMSFVQLARKPAVTPESLQRYHEVILDCAKRCRDIINSLRNFSRQPVKRELRDVKLEQVCKNALVLFETRDGVRLELYNNAPHAVVLGSANELQQVLVNLIQNALDASGGEARVQVSVSEAEDGQYLLAVDDAGPGVRVDERAQIFEPFYTTKPEGVGTGLGLAICHAFVQQHQGSLQVTGSELGGARFEIRLPPAAATQVALGEMSQLASTSGRT